MIGSLRSNHRECEFRHAFVTRLMIVGRFTVLSARLLSLPAGRLKDCMTNSQFTRQLGLNLAQRGPVIHPKRSINFPEGMRF